MLRNHLGVYLETRIALYFITACMAIYCLFNSCTVAPSFLFSDSFCKSTISWSISFYPQPILNWRRRSTSGFTLDFAVLNVLGFACYSISTAAFLFSASIRRQYSERHPLAPETTVQFNDLAFALHALLCCIITVSQFNHRCWGFKGKPATASRTVLGIICGCAFGVAIVGIIVCQGKQYGPLPWGSIDVVRDPLICHLPNLLSTPLM